MLPSRGARHPTAPRRLVCRGIPPLHILPCSLSSRLTPTHPSRPQVCKTRSPHSPTTTWRYPFIYLGVLPPASALCRTRIAATSSLSNADPGTKHAPLRSGQPTLQADALEAATVPSSAADTRQVFGQDKSGSGRSRLQPLSRHIGPIRCLHESGDPAASSRAAWV